ncbi:hypothetical protein SAMN05660649_01778 [Desulfotomaculum arcticum]|uniref:Sporulation membrane protein YtrI C-terminal domain-containing protein n=1 Tax=Desulfotruncus arcticus DSM 17038 TaxID=1121424 RepID=A0A1I2S8J2_9FIRM|nr:hypothetical protein [Desulfotruncus arcticus]SFG48019.1 hypothetical protein SAMN05660649_01778 [Desulfotomaculum arcticum] [Desulfotruncus arcticus DSM 17038]
MKRVLFFTAVFSLGILLGATLSGVLVGIQIDALYIENRSLREKISVNEKEIKELKENNASYRRIITKVSTKVSFDDKCKYTDYEKSTIELTVDKKVREWLKVITGQEVESVNYQLVPGIIDNREIEVEGNKIRVKITMVVIAENVLVYLEVIPIKNPS